jgi:transposase
VTKLVHRVKRTGSLAPARQGGDRRSARIEAHAEEILALVAAAPDLTLEEIAAHLKRAHGERFVVSTIWRCLDRHGLTFKKNGARQRAGARRRGSGPGGVARGAA